MSIDQFMSENVEGIKIIIKGLAPQFSSHDFIEKFAQKYEDDYIDMLVMYKGRSAFQEVHKQIAKFLSKEAVSLSIEKSSKKLSENVFGSDTEVQWWFKAQ